MLQELNGVPALLCPHAHGGCVAASRLGVSLSILQGLVHGHVGHAEDPRLHVKTLGHLRAGALHGHYGDLSHLIGAAGHLRQGRAVVSSLDFQSRNMIIEMDQVQNRPP